MKFDLNPLPTPDQAADMSVNPSDSVAYDVATSLGYAGDDFPHQLDQVKVALNMLQQPAATPEARAALRALATNILHANPESPVSDQGETGQFDSARFGGSFNG